MADEDDDCVRGVVTAEVDISGIDELDADESSCVVEVTLVALAAPVVDEDEAIAVVDWQQNRFWRRGIAPPVLQRDAPVVLPFGRFDRVRHAQRERVKPLEERFEFLAGKQITGLRATRRHELKDAPERWLDLLQQPDKSIELAEVLPGESRVDLHFQPCLACR